MGEGAGTPAPQTAGEGVGEEAAQQGRKARPAGQRSGESLGAAWAAQAHRCRSQTAAAGSPPAGGEGVGEEGVGDGQMNPEVVRRARGCSSATEERVPDWACLAWAIHSSWMETGCRSPPPRSHSLLPKRTGTGYNNNEYYINNNSNIITGNL